MRPELEAVVALWGASIVGFFPPAPWGSKPMSNSCVFSPLPISTQPEWWIHCRRSSWGGILVSLTRGLHRWDGACRNGGSAVSRRAGRGAAAAAGTPPGPGWGISVAPAEHGWRHVIIQYGGGGRSSPSGSCGIYFLSSVNFCAISIFLFPFWIQNFIQGGGSWANPSHESIYGHWPACPGSPVITA